jgi:hypothetical protein
MNMVSLNYWWLGAEQILNYLRRAFIKSYDDEVINYAFAAYASLEI